MTIPLFNHLTSNGKQNCKVAYDAPNAIPSLIHSFQYHLQARAPHQSTTIVCIGTDRSTGDCLGPLVGTKLSRTFSSRYRVLGTLQQPVHAMNLQETIESLHVHDPHTFIIAVDACLGQSNSIGIVQILDGPVHPGAGVNKKLPLVGNMHITGIVNIEGFMEYFVLQNTRLHLVMSMATVITETIERALTPHHNYKC